MPRTLENYTPLFNPPARINFEVLRQRFVSLCTSKPATRAILFSFISILVLVCLSYVVVRPTAARALDSLRETLPYALSPNPFVFLTLIPTFTRLRESERIHQYSRSQLQKTGKLYRKCVSRYLRLAALIGSVAWLTSEPKWEPALAFIVSLAAFLSLDLQTMKSNKLPPEVAHGLGRFAAQQVVSDRLVYLLRHLAQSAGSTFPARFAEVLAEWHFKDKGHAYAKLSVEAKGGWENAAEYACGLLVLCGLARQLGSEVIISQLGREMIQSKTIRADFPEAISLPLMKGF